MILIYCLVGIVMIHILFLFFPIYREEVLDVYLWTPWTDDKYVLFRKAIGGHEAVKIRLLTNWLSWPFRLAYILVLPIVFLFKLPDMLKEYDGEISYSKDGKTLIKVAGNCRRVKVKKGVEVIASRAFDSTRVIHVKLPDTVKILEPDALLRAHCLESINLPDSIIKIDRFAFRFCGGLGKGLKKVTLPKHLHYLGVSAFYGCNKLEKLVIRGDFMWERSWLEDNPFFCTDSLSVIQSSNPNFKVEDGMLMSADGKILFRCVNDNKKVVVKDGIETIAQGAFCERNRMEEVILPTSLRTICNCAFDGCHEIDNVELPEGTESIGVGSFSFCWNLKTMTLPASLKKIAPAAFEHSDHLQNFIYPKGMEDKFKEMINDEKWVCPF